jgi:hypothetical protein
MCNAAHDGVDRVCRWERIADIAAYVLLAPGEIHEGHLRHARKALSDLFVLLVDDTAVSGSDARHREADDARTHHHGVCCLPPWTNSPTPTRQARSHDAATAPPPNMSFAVTVRECNGSHSPSS